MSKSDVLCPDCGRPRLIDGQFVRGKCCLEPGCCACLRLQRNRYRRALEEIQTQYRNPHGGFIKVFETIMEITNKALGGE
jgi:hypothetical protein